MKQKITLILTSIFLVISMFCQNHQDFDQKKNLIGYWIDKEDDSKNVTLIIDKDFFIYPDTENKKYKYTVTGKNALSVDYDNFIYKCNFFLNKNNDTLKMISAKDTSIFYRYKKI